MLPFRLNKVVQMNLVKVSGSQIELLKIPVNKSICLRKFSAINHSKISHVSSMNFLSVPVDFPVNLITAISLILSAKIHTYDFKFELDFYFVQVYL